MKKRATIFLLLLSLPNYTCIEFEIDGIVMNNSDYNLNVTTLGRSTESYIKENLDTTMMSWYPFVYITPVPSRFAHHYAIFSWVKNYEDAFPKRSDTLSVFIFRNLTYQEYILAEPDNETDFVDYIREFRREVFQKDDYYVRYDISKQDIPHLVNSDGAVLLYFPPDERMKRIKMWPPYEEVVEKYSPKD